MDFLGTLIVLFLVIAGFLGFLFLMIFFPEWVGITGKSAEKTNAEHVEGAEVDDSDVFSNRRRR